MSYFGGSANSLAFPSYNQVRPFQTQQQNSSNNSSGETVLSSVAPPHSNLHTQSPVSDQALNQQRSLKLSQKSAQPQAENQHTVRISKRERKNRPGQKFGAKKKSWVWTWFIQDVQDPNVAACDYCGKIITRLASDKGSPKKLSEHLKTHKLNRESINNSRPIPVDGNGTTYAPNGLPLSYANANANFSTHPGPSPSPSHDHGHSHGHAPGAIPVSNSNLATSPTSGEHTKRDNNSLLKDSYHQNLHLLNRSQHQNQVMQQPSQLSQHQLQQHILGSSHPAANNSVLPTNSQATNNLDFNVGRRFISTEFDNAPYTTMKFQKHLMKFLIENKLSISVIKSQSFQQLIYDLRSDSVSELLELTGLCSSLLEVSRFDSNSLDQSKRDSNISASTSANNGNRSNDINAVTNVVDSLEQAVEKNL
ncbi:hypothetical protein CLIB1423_06S01772 [[Candida] railenensis]|uniref:BED-type domain-containing protein n=1 Tax=[Candida] railenensis TaxID=45579 RepID=A0A9P0QP96_9ASCO|nr:hypothetical protein CLIB1423_06S01772 [[Candida] railenensis]